MEPCRRCGHDEKLHSHVCPCAPGKKMCTWTNGETSCICNEYKSFFEGEKK